MNDYSLGRIKKIYDVKVISKLVFILVITIMILVSAGKFIWGKLEDQKYVLKCTLKSESDNIVQIWNRDFADKKTGYEAYDTIIIYYRDKTKITNSNFKNLKEKLIAKGYSGNYELKNNKVYITFSNVVAVSSVSELKSETELVGFTCK